MSGAQEEHETFWAGVHGDYARLNADPAGWLTYQEELALFEGTSLDGLEDEAPYYSPEEEAEIRAGHVTARRRRALAR